MSRLLIRRFRESCKSPKDERNHEQIIQLKKQRSSHIGQLTKTINKVTDLIDREKSFEEVVKCNDLLEISIKAIRDITTKIIRHETDDKITEKEINIGTEQEFCLIQIRKLIDSYCGNVENVSLFKNTPLKHTSFSSNKDKQISNSRGFNLTKFLSNSHKILKSLPNSILSPKLVDLDFDKIPLERVLGILWDPNEDVLKVKVLCKEVPNTKRGIISFTSSIFDPLEMNSPAILEPKLLIQELWKRNIDWDELIPLDILTRWNIWKQYTEFKRCQNRAMVQISFYQSCRTAHIC